MNHEEITYRFVTLPNKRFAKVKRPRAKSTDVLRLALDYTVGMYRTMNETLLSPVASEALRNLNRWNRGQPNELPPHVLSPPAPGSPSPLVAFVRESMR